MNRHKIDYHNIPSVFILPNGERMKFYINSRGRCNDLKNAIKLSGAEVVNEINKNCVCLATPNAIVDSYIFIHSNYVWDCIEKRTRVSMQNYAVVPGIPVPLTPIMDDDYSSFECECPSIASNKSRKPFTIQESAALSKYIIENNLEPSMLSNHKIWLQIEAANVTDHCAESMRSHYRQVLKPKKKKLLRNKICKPPVHVHTITKLREPLHIQVNSSMINDNCPTFVLNDQLLSPISSSSPRRMCFGRPIKTKLKTLDSNLTKSPSMIFSEVSLLLPDHSKTIPNILSNRSSVLTSDLTNSTFQIPRPSWIEKLLHCSPNLTNHLQVILLVSMTNGSIREAYNFLTYGQRHPNLSEITKSPPLWTLENDTLLTSTSTDDIERIVDRFGWPETHARMVYLSDSGVKPKRTRFQSYSVDRSLI